MAKRSAQDTAAAKAKKQKIILIVGGVLLLAVAAIQGPKLMKGGGSAAAPPPAAAVADDRRTGAAGAGRGRGDAPPRASAVVAGVALPRSQGRQGRDEPACVVHALRGQGSVRARRSATRRRAPTRHDRSGSDRRSGTGADGHRHVGRLQRLELGLRRDARRAAAADRLRDDRLQHASRSRSRSRSTFPTPEPLFVLRSLTKKQAKIGVAGGSFDGGKPVTLKLGKKVTLVNTATGVRYVLKLVYTGVAARGHRGLHDRERCGRPPAQRPRPAPRDHPRADHAPGDI